jgi:hypothetical protein
MIVFLQLNAKNQTDRGNRLEARFLPDISSEKNWLNFFCLAEKNSFQKDFQPKVSIFSFRERIEREIL